MENFDRRRDELRMQGNDKKARYGFSGCGGSGGFHNKSTLSFYPGVRAGLSSERFFAIMKSVDV